MSFRNPPLSVSLLLTASIIRETMTEATSTSETSVYVYQTTCSNNPEDSHLHTRRRENLNISPISRRQNYSTLAFNQLLTPDSSLRNSQSINQLQNFITAFTKAHHWTVS
jgi:hypothetical protein